MVVGPTKPQPRRLRSFESAVEVGVVGIALTASHVNGDGRSVAGGTHDQA